MNKKISSIKLFLEEVIIPHIYHFGNCNRTSGVKLKFGVFFCFLLCLSPRAMLHQGKRHLTNCQMNSVGELVETILSRINIADTNELEEAVEFWKGASGGASLPDDPSRQKGWDPPIGKKNWNNILL